jgi:serine/threonine protein kinase
LVLQGSLRDALDRSLLSGISGWPLPAVVLSLAHDVASALLHLHEGGIVHGDIKASNVLLTGAGAKDLRTGGMQWKSVRAKVADFGLALLLDSSDTHATHNSRVSGLLGAG